MIKQENLTNREFDGYVKTNYKIDKYNCKDSHTHIQQPQQQQHS